MKFIRPINGSQNKKQSNIHVMVTGLFIVVSYILNLLPLALFAIAQTMAIFGRKRAALLSLGILALLWIFAIATGFAPMMLAAVLALISVPLFLIVSVLRQKQTSIFWSAGVLLTPIVLFFSTILFAPSLHSEQFNQEIDKVEKIILKVQTEKQADFQKNEASYTKVIDQIELLKKDTNLRTFMEYNTGQRLLYFVYGNGFAIFLIVLLSFFASLFFLDFAFEQIEKLFAINKYIKRTSDYSFDPMLILMLNDVVTKNNQNNVSTSDLQVIKHAKQQNFDNTSRTFFGLLRKPNPENCIVFRNYLFFFTGRVPGWGLRTYQLPLSLCMISILLLSGIVFYFGSVQSIIDSLSQDGNLQSLLLYASLASMCVLAFLVLQGIFTALKWIPFGILIIISIVFLILSPFILVDLGPFVFLGLFGVIGLLGYLK